MEILKNEPFVDEKNGTKGQYTLKRYYLERYIESHEKDCRSRVKYYEEDSIDATLNGKSRTTRYTMNSTRKYALLDLKTSKTFMICSSSSKSFTSGFYEALTFSVTSTNFAGC